MTVLSTTLRVASGVTLPGEGALEIAVDVLAPPNPKPEVLVCLPGGAMTRKYFDLRAPGDDSFSFARQMAARGYACVLIDHLGVGESTRPADGYALDAFLLAYANASATRQVLDKLGNGSAINGLKAIPHVRSVGIGHSMGAMLTIVQQAQNRQHAGIAVLGFSTRGLPEYLMGEAKELDPAAARREVARFARAMFRDPYPKIGRSSDGSQLYAGLHADPAGIQAIKSARELLLPVPAYMSMLPGNVAPEAASIDVPVFVGLGELDMAGPPEDAPKAFTKSPSVTLQVLPKAGHSHFLFPARTELYDGLAAWVAGLPQKDESPRKPRP
ncbi:MAG TPA: alpha/beta fold hydrolase [Verrucomicrobiae bacterium]|nr:alpha/beta fold hydrolase [Verrucomicrobiae bacterium]